MKCHGVVALPVYHLSGWSVQRLVRVAREREEALVTQRCATALAESLAQACNLPVFYLQGMEGLTLADVLYDWDREAQTQWVRQAIATGRSFEEARAGQWSREFLKLGEALAAYEYASHGDAVPILICGDLRRLWLVSLFALP